MTFFDAKSMDIVARRVNNGQAVFQIDGISIRLEDATFAETVFEIEKDLIDNGHA